MYNVVISPKAQKMLSRMDKHTQRLLVSWMEKNLQGCDNPKAKGKPLAANRKNQWRYRVGDYRIIAEIFEDKILIQVINVGHRRDVYEI